MNLANAIGILSVLARYWSHDPWLVFMHEANSNRCGRRNRCTLLQRRLQVAGYAPLHLRSLASHRGQTFELAMHGSARFPANYHVLCADRFAGLQDHPALGRLRWHRPPHC